MAALVKGKQMDTGANGVATANLKDLGVTTAKLAATGVTAAKLGSDVAGGNLSGGNGAAITDGTNVLLADGTRAMTAALALGTNRITGLAAPTADTDAARKQDVDAVAAGLAWKDAAKLATTAALPAVTYANGTAGVGATLTADAVGVITIDGTAVVLNDRVLIKDQVAGLQNGPYDCTTEGTAGVAAVFTRVTDADVSAELDGATLAVQQGTTNAETRWSQTVSGATIGTTALSFTNIGGLGEVTAGTGLTKSVNTINAGDANKGVQVNADDLEIDASEITGDGVVEVDAGSSSHKLKVKPDSITGGDTAAVTVGANGVGVDVGTLDGDHLDVDFTPAEYTPDATPSEAADVDDLAAHLKGISDEFAATGRPTQEAVTTQVITGADTAVTDTLDSTPASNASVSLFLNGIMQEQGAGKDYTISGATITWLASTGTAVDMETSDTLLAKYAA